MLQSKFVLYIKFNGCLIVLLVGFFVVVSAHRWLMQMQNWSAYPFVAGLELRNHPVVDGVFQIVWITAVASLYQALWLEVELLLYPIGFMLGLEVLLVAAGDVIKRWNDEAEDCFLRRGQDGVVWIALLAYFYYTLYILKQLFRTKNRKSSIPPGATGYPLVSVQ
ncbi:AGAP007315-PA [Anopheles gambiae str. PEST]|uniref:AGAP007315-PA n=2 Tax=gambiae species complex TaxID=44542 RepID=A0NBE4_ANOGA|nr:AGAP007315-PA [Anopheles gambiae str. PEST]